MNGKNVFANKQNNDYFKTYVMNSQQNSNISMRYVNNNKTLFIIQFTTYYSTTNQSDLKI